MGPIANSTDAYQRGGHSLPARSAVEPKGGVPDTFITFRNPPARDAVCAKWGLGYCSEIKGESARMGRNCENESRNAIKSLGIKVFVRPWMESRMHVPEWIPLYRAIFQSVSVVTRY
jgi:hypothetical protein